MIPALWFFVSRSWKSPTWRSRNAASHQGQIEIEEVARRLPQDVELWLGGRAAPSIGAAIGPRGLVLADFDGLELQLARVAGA
jgi:hypothetical protein